MTPTVLVTGAGRGVGRATALGALARGWRAVAGVRDVPGSAYPAHPDLLVTELDVADPGSVREGVATAEAFAGGPLAALVNNAAYAVIGAQEDADLDEVRAMFETNLLGAAAVTQRALPAMREAGRGVVVYVSSSGVRLCLPLLGFYQASKAGLGVLGEALAVEGRPFGIRAAVVEPGMVATGFPRATRPSGSAAGGDGPYADLAVELRQGFRRWRDRQEVSAEAVAEAILDAIADPGAPFRIEVGEDARTLGRERAATDDRTWRQRIVDLLELDWPSST
jgi:NAD(P)-dependent dehydrogenase (short-subunit alcohol dehydrogenase family)